ncbi:MAG: response regulator transcription factor [Chloroflexaceae bacterium]|nr:response regulator transcription factor [Chloroflexaceae bacterium]
MPSIEGADPKPLVMVVEDEPKVAEIILTCLRPHFMLELARSYDEAVNMLKTSTPDVLLLDIILGPNPEDKDAGYQLCRQVRRGIGSLASIADVQILMLTVRDGEKELEYGLDLGADDYMPKHSFRCSELVARVRARVRRSRHEPRNVFDIGPLRIDISRGLVWLEGQELPRITPTEFAILHELAAAHGEVVPIKTLYHNVLGYDYEPGMRNLDVHMSNLRRKFKATREEYSNLIKPVRQRIRIGNTLEWEEEPGYRLLPVQ